MIPYLVSGGVMVCVAVLGGLATDINGWYRQLRKPAWQPPDWLFGPVWTTIFGLMAWSGALAWTSATSGTQRVLHVVLPFAVNLILNVLWSWLFFRLRRPRLALVEVAALWLSIGVLMATLWPVATLAALLLIPYLVWVSFAAVLNATIVRLNPDVS